MSVAATCPHGLAQGSCEICRVLGGGPPEQAPARRAEASARATRWSGGSRLRLGAGAVLVLVGVVVVLQVVAAVWAVVHVLQLVAVALVAGWIGWRVGLIQGTRRGP